jgi:hypothetical protein
MMIKAGVSELEPFAKKDRYPAICSRLRES